MRRFSKHDEPWGEYVDVKCCGKSAASTIWRGADVTLGSVTDPYNPVEERYMLTRAILNQLKSVDCNLYVITKSKLVLRDIDLLKEQKNLVVAISLNTLDDSFRADMDRASTVQERLDTMRALHDAGIYVVLFCSPMFPGLTNFKEIIEATREFIDEYWFEDLNLRSDYRPVILNYIREKYPWLYPTYEAIYVNKFMSYWENTEAEFASYCEANNIRFLSAFGHSKLVADRKAGQKWR